MAQGEKNKKNSPFGDVRNSEKMKKAQTVIDNVASRISYNDFKNTAEKIIRAK